MELVETVVVGRVVVLVEVGLGQGLVLVEVFSGGVEFGQRPEGAEEALPYWSALAFFGPVAFLHRNSDTV